MYITDSFECNKHSIAKKIAVNRKNGICSRAVQSV